MEVRCWDVVFIMILFIVGLFVKKMWWKGWFKSVVVIGILFLMIVILFFGKSVLSIFLVNVEVVLLIFEGFRM